MAIVNPFLPIVLSMLYISLPYLTQTVKVVAEDINVGAGSKWDAQSGP